MASAHDVLNFMSEFARSYLGSGGPTSRLEEYLAKLGEKLGYRTEVYATPTGVFLSCIDTHGANHTTLCRITDSSMSLGKLVWLEEIIADLRAEKISVSQAYRILHGKKFKSIAYSVRARNLAAFVSGFALSYPAFGSIPAALASAFISLATFYIGGPGLKGRIPNGVFRDFAGGIITLWLSALAQMAFAKFHTPMSFEAYAIGGLIILVPGLALTTAIAELADQNLVSGTAKLMQAMLTLLALALAYTLFLEFSKMPAGAVMRDVTTTTLPVAKGLSFILRVLGVMTSVACFGIIFSVPAKTLPWVSLTGLVGWFIMRQFDSTNQIVVASYLASTVVGTVSLLLAQRFKMPSQVYSVPGILAMLPGMLALSTFNTLASGNNGAGIGGGVKVVMIASAIVFGLFSARIPFAIIGSTSLLLKPRGQKSKG